eukprot:2669791-Amphidinium_carterae.1
MAKQPHHVTALFFHYSFSLVGPLIILLYGNVKQFVVPTGGTLGAGNLLERSGERRKLFCTVYKEKWELDT